MDVLITGGTGFIGQALCQALLAQKQELGVFCRHPARVASLCGHDVRAVSSLDEMTAYSPRAIVNLAGLPIADKRWSAARKNALLASRVTLTETLVSQLASMPVKPEVLVSASAVGFYGDCGNSLLDESAHAHAEFTHELCAAWEQAALAAEQYGVRVCLLRIGLVVGPNGGFLRRMLLPFRLGLGGRLGDGQQWMSWVHQDDVVAMIMYLLEHITLRGVFNGTAPEPVRNQEFTQLLAGVLSRPALLPVPGLLLELGLGEMSRLLLTGQRVLPQRLLEAGFEFKYPTLRPALKSVL